MDLKYDLNFKNPLIGVDEVGRGSWAGPVVASAAMLISNKFLDKRLNDSKKLKSNIRLEVLENIKKFSIFGIGLSTNLEIDNYGIVAATFMAMERSINDILYKTNKRKVRTILIDGTLKPTFGKNFDAEIILIKKGDTLSPSVAAASIFAKCYRDEIMIQMDKELGNYGFLSNKGYGTKEHERNLFKFGPSRVHRKTFNPIKKLLLN